MTTKNDRRKRPIALLLALVLAVIALGAAYTVTSAALSCDATYFKISAPFTEVKRPFIAHLSFANDSSFFKPVALRSSKTMSKYKGKSVIKNATGSGWSYPKRCTKVMGPQFYGNAKHLPIVKIKRLIWSNQIDRY